MRLLVLFLIGLVLGVAGTLIAMNALNRQTPWSKATMGVMGHQMKAMGESIKANHCATNDLLPKLQTMRMMANDIEPAFTGEIRDAQFNRYAADLRAAVDSALVAPPGTCATANATMTSLDKACDSCHRDFRN